MQEQQAASGAYDSILSQYDTSGYCWDGNSSDIGTEGHRKRVRYGQDNHNNMLEVTEMNGEIEHGVRVLYENGILKRSMQMVNGYMKGWVCMYNNGLPESKVKWEDVQRMDEDEEYAGRFILNHESGKKVMEERYGSGKVRYRGEYDLCYRRHGFGIEYDDKGVEMFSGIYENGKLTRKCRIFRKNEKTNCMEMIEYRNEGEADTGNLSSYMRCPEYVGGYIFDEKKFEFLRHGKGNLLDEITGVCTEVCQWEMGNKVHTILKPNANGCFQDDLNFNTIILGDLKDWMENNAEYQQEVTVCEQHKVKVRKDIMEFRVDEKNHNTAVGSLSSAKFQLSGLPFLTRIIIERKACESISSLVISNLKNLVEVTVREECFVVVKGDRSYMEVRLPNRELSIKDCPSLKTITIGKASFRDYSDLTLESLPSLENIHFGEECFYYVKTLCLKDLPKLTSVEFGASSFSFTSQVIFQNLGELRTIKYINGNHSMQGDHTYCIDEYKTSIIADHTKNTFIMKNLPNLVEIKTEDRCEYIGQWMTSIDVEDVPKLKRENIAYTRSCFREATNPKITNAPGLKAFFDERVRRPN